MTIDAAADLLRCPVCEDDLELAGRTTVCPKRHSFDLARQGYLNLLQGAAPANADSAQMVAARDRFLESGVYSPLAEVLSTATAGEVFLEAGAGTGYYLSRALADHDSARGLATDVSVAAVKKAARAHDRMAAVVADTWKSLPVRTGTIDTVSCVFAPRNLPEFHRVLAPGGMLLVATPLPGHLSELRSAYGLLEVEADKQEKLLRSAAQLFKVEDSLTVNETVTLEPWQVADVIAMGPNAFHNAPPEPDSPVAVSVAVNVTCFRANV